MANALIQRDLMFGLLALQNGLVSREALLDGLAEWLLESKRPLGRILLDRKSLTADDFVYLNQLVDGCSIGEPGLPLAGQDPQGAGGSETKTSTP